MKDGSQCIVVLGMHRSGTSAIARGLQALGVELGDRLIPSRPYNPTGYWEDADLLDINRRLMRALRINWNSVALVEPSQWESDTVQALRQEAAGTVRRRFASYPLWGFKDPRTIRVLPFWQGVLCDLGIADKYVVCVRHPRSIVRSLILRNELPPERTYLLWLVHMVPHLHCLRDRPCVMVDYDTVMAEPTAQLRRVASVLRLAITPHVDAEVRRYAEEFLTQDLRHSHFGEEDLDGDRQMGELCREAFEWLRRLAQDEASLQSEAFWTDWQRITRTLEAVSPAYRHIDELLARIEEMDQRIAAIRGSWSWRITAPLRALKRLVGRGIARTQSRPD